MLIPPLPVLRCEYLRNPLGVNDPSARLSWILSHKGRIDRRTGGRSSPSNDNRRKNLSILLIFHGDKVKIIRTIKE